MLASVYWYIIENNDVAETTRGGFLTNNVDIIDQDIIYRKGVLHIGNP